VNWLFRSLKNGNDIGQIDADSHQLAPFTKRDELLLEAVSGLYKDFS